MDLIERFQQAIASFNKAIGTPVCSSLLTRRCDLPLYCTQVKTQQQ
ncbi:MAG: hypothetical protein V7L04_18155 [Nostoc sp.]